MLNRLHRLTKTKDIDAVFKSGRASHDKFIGIKSTNNHGQYSRFAVLVSKKVSKKAVIRNKLKRQIRHIVKNNLSEIRPGFDNIIITKPLIVESGYTELENKILFHLKKLSLIYDK